MTMKKSASLISLLFVLLAVAAEARGQAGAGSTTKVSERVETVRFQSELMGREIPYSVLLPEGYAKPENRSTYYPVLYLLHGLTGHYDDWLTRTKLADHAAQYQMLIVTPEGGNGWYTDSASVASDKYESYVMQELIADVAGRYRTIISREARAVAGLSMGGYGALKFGLKYSSKFVFAASMSGALRAASWNREDELPRGLIRRSLVQTFGAASSPTRQANDLFKLFREFPRERIHALPFFYLDCGTEDELGLLPANRALADIFVARKIPHEYRQLPGKHNWQYWNAQVQDILKMAAERMLKPQASEGRVARSSRAAPSLAAHRRTTRLQNQAAPR